MHIELALVALLAASVAAQVNPYADCCDTYCYRDDENPYLYMGTKTAYEFVYGKSSNQHVVPYCRPVLFWSFNRHGTRLPNRNKIIALEKLQKLKEDIIKNYEQRASYPETGKLCDRDLEIFKRWNWNYSITENSAYTLTDQGKDDLRYLARRYQTRYPDLLRRPYSDQHFKFRYSEGEFTRSSYEAYVEGLFNNEAYRVHAVTVNNDTLLNANRYCSSQNSNVEDDNVQVGEYVRFMERDEYKRVVAHVSRRLGYRYTLNASLVLSMWDMCRREKAWAVNRPSAWCAAFTKDQLRLLEYAEDLRNYYLYGYGNDNNPRKACQTVKDMMERFDRVVNGAQNEPRVVIYFSESAALELLLVSLGMVKDSFPLMADNMHIHKIRKWRTSLMDPYAANLAAVLYQCNEGEKDRVMFFLNEKPVEYPGCAVGLCSWRYLKEQLRERLDLCTGDSCQYGFASQNTAVNSLILIGTLLVFLYRV